MPSAEDLRAVAASYDPVEDFLNIATRQIEIAARTGLTYEYIDVPGNPVSYTHLTLPTIYSV